LPINGDKNEWKEMREKLNGLAREGWQEYNEYIMSLGFPSLPKYRLISPSPYLNLYGYPEEIDYTDIRTMPSNWLRFDSFKRNEKHENFEIPLKLKNKSGKLIYFSLGSMGAANVELMKRLISILSKSQHKFIVSKGPLSEQYNLAHNMWGEKTVPQVQVLPFVDLVITHGGNNTVTETLFYGKPMIVMPLFGDQFDNAQRLQETGYGLRLDPHNCTHNELLEGIENLLNNNELAAKLEKISKRIQSSNSLSKVVDSIEGLVKQNGYID
jgi:UDP:flavonoid glycosyltransferase YjiC (YdhE family)